MTWLTRLLARLRGEDPEYVWKPTGLRFTTARDYEQHRATALYKRSLKQSASGRKYAAVKRDGKPKATVVEFRRGAK